MASEGKVRKGFYIEEDLLEQMDGLLEQEDAKSRNEFLNQALKKLQVKYTDEVKRINGAISFEDAYHYQNEN